MTAIAIFFVPGIEKQQLVLFHSSCKGAIRDSEIWYSRKMRIFQAQWQVAMRTKITKEITHAPQMIRRKEIKERMGKGNAWMALDDKIQVLKDVQNNRK